MSYERIDFMFPPPPVARPTWWPVCFPLGNLEAGLAAAGMEGQDLVVWKEACTWVGRVKGLTYFCGPEVIATKHARARCSQIPLSSCTGRVCQSGCFYLQSAEPED